MLFSQEQSVGVISNLEIPLSDPPSKEYPAPQGSLFALSPGAENKISTHLAKYLCSIRRKKNDNLYEKNLKNNNLF